MRTPRVLVVDDDKAVRTMLQEGLRRDGFEAVIASNVSDALRQIATEKFDVLLSDLHMPLAGDGFTVVSAMRHTHPKAVTLVFGGYPARSYVCHSLASRRNSHKTHAIQFNQGTYSQETGGTPKR
jgi:DNA-binding NtrC family response regulator